MADREEIHIWSHVPSLQPRLKSRIDITPTSRGEPEDPTSTICSHLALMPWSSPPNTLKLPPSLLATLRQCEVSQIMTTRWTEADNFVVTESDRVERRCPRDTGSSSRIGVMA